MSDDPAGPMREATSSGHPAQSEPPAQSGPPSHTRAQETTGGAPGSAPRVRVVAAVIEREGRVMVCQRPDHKRHGGLWEFPGGKVEAHEDDQAALHRELHEELRIEVVDVGPELYRNDDHGSHFTIIFFPTSVTGEPQPLEHQAIAWVDWVVAADLPLAPSDRRFVRYMLERAATDRAR